jgi:hypothetical protein
MSLSLLHPAQRFIYEFGAFAIWWSNLDLIMEVSVAKLEGRSAEANAELFAGTTSGRRRGMLTDVLRRRKLAGPLAELDRIFALAERNEWVHAQILNPNGDFSRFTRFRVTKDSSGITATNVEVSFEPNQFAAFYTALDDVQRALDVSVAEVDRYIGEVMASAAHGSR